MLYKRKDLPKRSFEDGRVAITRYMYKFINQRSEIKRLKWPEKDFLFHRMYIMRNDKGRMLFDMLTIPEARDWAFDYILLIYLGRSHTIDFTRPAYDYYGRVPDQRKVEHRNFFWQCMSEWKDKLEMGSDIYCNVLNREYQRKLESYENLPITKFQKNQRALYTCATFFHIYYIIRMYYDEKPQKYDMEEISGYKIVADVATYGHMLSRHYFGDMIEEDASLNEDIEIVDIKNLPESLLQIVSLYCNYGQLSSETEYILLAYKQVKYILWLKFGHIDSAKVTGFHIQTLYKCDLDLDLEKYKGRPMCHVNENLDFYI